MKAKLMPYRVSLPPTRPLLVMDICTIGFINKREQIRREGNKKENERLQELIAYAQARTHRFSFILAIIEKATDVIHPMSGEQMVERFMKDYGMIRGLIHEDDIFERPDTLPDLIRMYMDEAYRIEERAELKLHDYLAFLTAFDSLDIRTDPKDDDEILEKARQVAKIAAQLDIAPSHPVVIVCMASVCGCKDARRILRRKEGVFNASNAYGDILSFQRMARVRYEIHKFYPGLEILFRTEDWGLENMHTYYSYVITDVGDEGEYFGRNKFTGRKMFPLFFTKKRGRDKQKLRAVYDLLAIEYS